MLANQLKASNVPKNLNFFQTITKNRHIKKIGLGIAVGAGVAFLSYGIWRYLFPQEGKSRSPKDVISAETVKKALKMFLKESYPILRRGIVQVEELKQKLRKENHGHEPHNLNRIIFEKVMEKGKVHSMKNSLDLGAPLSSELDKLTGQILLECGIHDEDKLQLFESSIDIRSTEDP